MFLEAFVTELRATTFALQALLHAQSGFGPWYEVQREQMRANPKLRWLVEARNAAQKQGLTVASWGLHIVVRFPRQGPPFGESLPPTLHVSEVEGAVTLEDLSAMVEHLSLLVEEAHKRFYANPPGRQHQMTLETIRQRDDGTWEDFDVGGPAVRPHV